MSPLCCKAQLHRASPFALYIFVAFAWTIYCPTPIIVLLLVLASFQPLHIWINLCYLHSVLMDSSFWDSGFEGTFVGIASGFLPSEDV